MSLSTIVCQHGNLHIYLRLAKTTGQQHPKPKGVQQCLELHLQAYLIVEPPLWADLAVKRLTPVIGVRRVTAESLDLSKQGKWLWIAH
jgi:hypothetical protein